MDILGFLKDVLDHSMNGPYPYVILGIVAVMVFLEQIILVSLLSPGSYAVLLVSFMAFAGKVSIVLMIPLLFVAAMLGTHTQYVLGKHHGSRFLRWLNRYPRWVDLERLQTMRVHGGLVVLSYSLPQIRGIVPFLAGTSQMPMRRWLAWSAVGVAIWLTIFIGMGLSAASLFDGDLEKALDWVWQVNNNPILASIFWSATVLIAVYFIWSWRRPRSKTLIPEVTVPLAPDMPLASIPADHQIRQ